MADTKKTNTKPKQSKSSLVGSQAKPTTLDSNLKLDIDTNQVLVDNIIQAGLSDNLDLSTLSQFTSISNSREQIYDLIDTMAADSDVAAIIKVYAEEVCETSDNGHVVWAESDDPKVSMFVNYLLNVLNVDKKIYNWAYNLIKYGDVYLRLYRESEYQDILFDTDKIKKVYGARNVLNENLNEDINLNIHSPSDPYSYYVEMVSDPSTMFELTKLGTTFGYIETPYDENNNINISNYLTSTIDSSNNSIYNYRMKSNDINIYQADDFVHACLEDNSSRYPENVELFNYDNDLKTSSNSSAYAVHRGKSMLYDSYKVWREKTLLEQVILLNRVTKSSVVRTVQVEVGNMGKTQAQNTLRKVKELFEQKSAINTNKSFGEYANMGPVENNIYLTTHNGQGAITVGTVGGDVDVKNLADLDNWTNKFYGSFGIPKQYFSQTDDGAGFNGGTALSITSSVFAKGVKRIQNSLIQAINDLINLILVNKGCISYLNNFVIKMKTPITQEEINYRESLSNRITAISNMQSLFSNVEDKARQLEILKQLVSTLNYGDELLQILDEEIEAAKAAAEEAKIKAEEDAALEQAEKEENNDSDLDLGMSGTALEELENKTTSAEPLVEEINLDNSLEETEFITESDELPTPEELNKEIDFSKNI